MERPPVMKSHHAARWIRFGAVVAVVGLTGCAPQSKSLYHWEGYQRQLYEYFKGTESDAQQQLRLLQAQAQKAQGAGAALPPGFRAHVGLLYLNLGRADEAQQQFESEKANFPESTPYMDFLLRRMSTPRLKPDATPPAPSKTDSAPVKKPVAPLPAVKPSKS